MEGGQLTTMINYRYEQQRDACCETRGWNCYLLDGRMLLWSVALLLVSLITPHYVPRVWRPRNNEEEQSLGDDVPFDIELVASGCCQRLMMLSPAHDVRYCTVTYPGSVPRGTNPHKPPPSP